MTEKVTACIVTYNSQRYLRRCLDALGTQTRRPARILVWDNASHDGSAELAEQLGASVTRAQENVGFAQAANELIRRTTTPYILLLNPDAYLQPRYVEQLEQAADADPAIGSVTGKLVRPARPGEAPVLDSTGHVLHRNRVATNRGENEPDRGQYDGEPDVFGVCAAAALYRRAMLDDVRVGDEYFDSTFFVYLEDVDLDWRAQLRGWKACYVPTAVAEHERGHAGIRRRQSTREIRHSLKNRYLMMLRNAGPGELLPDLGPILFTEVLRLLDYGLGNPAALLGYVRALRCLPHAVATRRQIQSRRLVDSAALRSWLQPYPFTMGLRRRLSRARDRSANMTHIGPPPGRSDASAGPAGTPPASRRTTPQPPGPDRKSGHIRPTAEAISPTRDGPRQRRLRETETQLNRRGSRTGDDVR